MNVEFKNNRLNSSYEERLNFSKQLDEIVTNIYENIQRLRKNLHTQKKKKLKNDKSKHSEKNILQAMLNELQSESPKDIHIFKISEKTEKIYQKIIKKIKENNKDFIEREILIKIFNNNIGSFFNEHYQPIDLELKTTPEKIEEIVKKTIEETTEHVNKKINSHYNGSANFLYKQALKKTDTLIKELNLTEEHKKYGEHLLEYFKENTEHFLIPNFYTFIKKLKCVQPEFFENNKAYRFVSLKSENIDEEIEEIAKKTVCNIHQNFLKKFSENLIFNEIKNRENKKIFNKIYNKVKKEFLKTNPKKDILELFEESVQIFLLYNINNLITELKITQPEILKDNDFWKITNHELIQKKLLEKSKHIFNKVFISLQLIMEGHEKTIYLTQKNYKIFSSWITAQTQSLESINNDKLEKNSQSHFLKGSRLENVIPSLETDDFNSDLLNDKKIQTLHKKMLEAFHDYKDTLPSHIHTIETSKEINAILKRTIGFKEENSLASLISVFAFLEIKSFIEEIEKEEPGIFEDEKNWEIKLNNISTNSKNLNENEKIIRHTVNEMIWASYDMLAKNKTGFEYIGKENLKKAKIAIFNNKLQDSITCKNQIEDICCYIKTLPAPIQNRINKASAESKNFYAFIWHFLTEAIKNAPRS